MIFTVRLSDISIQIDSIYDEIYIRCKDYLTDEPPTIYISITEEDIAKERELSKEADIIENRPITEHTDKYLEVIATYRRICERIWEYKSFFFHSSAIMYDGKAYIFTAPSGTGKSTHSKLWGKLLGDSAVIINDDKPLIRFFEKEIIVYGTPWNGKHSLSKNISAPLAGICVLSQSPKNTIEQINPMDALPKLLTQTYRYKNKEFTESLLPCFIRMSNEIPIFSLQCNMELEAAELSFKTMGGLI